MYLIDDVKCPIFTLEVFETEAIEKGILTMARMNLDLSDTKIQQFDDLMKRSGITVRKDLFNEALSLYSRFLQIVEEGGSLPLAETHSGKQKEIASPALVEIYDRVQAELKSQKTGT